jgi:protein TonB
LDTLVSRLVQAIEEHKSYPKAARRARLQGVVQVRVHIDQGAGIAGFELLESSGHKTLDKAAEAVFLKISGIRLYPYRLESALDILVPIRFESRP